MGSKAKTILQKSRELRELIEKSGKEAIQEILESFLAENPTVKRLRWTQYAPYFNDGDPCTFSVHEPEVELFSADAVESEEDEEDEDRDDYDDEGNFIDSWSLRDTDLTLKKNLDELSGAFQELSSVLESCLTEDGRVTVSRNPEGPGIVIECDECSHD